jgi:predicted XRE-type DNA-binding protein
MSSIGLLLLRHLIRCYQNTLFLQSEQGHAQILLGRRVSQIAAAGLLKISQPKISALANYRLDGFSAERLMHFLNALDCDVEIVIRRKPLSRKAAIILVTAA